MQVPSHGTLISWQQELEAKLTRLASDTRFTARISEPLVHEAAVAYLTRPSKRLLGMAFLHAAHMLGCDEYRFHDLIAVSAALEIRHGAILLHDDIVDGDIQRGGHPTAQHALRPPFGTEAASAALLAGDILVGMAPLPILRSDLPGSVRSRLCELFQANTALVAAGQIEQLHLDVRRNPNSVSEDEILRIHAGQFAPYLMCSIQLAGARVGLGGTALARITEAGVPLCQAFQVQNDLAGYTELRRILTSDPETDSALTLANTSDLRRRRRTVLVRAALNRLPCGGHAELTAYMDGADTDLFTVVGLIEAAGAAEHCTELIANLQAQSRKNISDNPQLPTATSTALTATWDYINALYDPASPISRLYLDARTDLIPTA
ncbi:polyprenyl synthetase family protein [Streptomyces sp. NPDC004749]